MVEYRKINLNCKIILKVLKIQQEKLVLKLIFVLYLYPYKNLWKFESINCKNEIFHKLKNFFILYTYWMIWKILIRIIPYETNYLEVF